MEQPSISILKHISGGLVGSPIDLEQIEYPEAGAARLAKVEQNHFWFVARRALILALLKHTLGRVGSAKIGIDVGCGSGFNAVWLSEQGWRTVGLDAYSGFDFYKKSDRGYAFLRGDLNSFEPRSEFDFALLLDVIEHIHDDGEFLRKTLSMLKPGGVAIVTVPAFQSLYTEIDAGAGHLRRYTLSDIKRLLAHLKKRQQVSVVYSTYFFATTLPLFALSRLSKRLRGQTETGSELTPHFLLNSLLKTLLMAEALLCRFIPLPIGSSLVFVLKRE